MEEFLPLIQWEVNLEIQLSNFTGVRLIRDTLNPQTAINTDAYDAEKQCVTLMMLTH